MDLFKKCFDYKDAQIARENGYYPYFIPFSGGDDTVMVYKGQPKIMIGSNNYLGLTHHPKVVEAAQQALKIYGTGRTGSRFLNGTLDIHEEFEHELAEFTNKEAALVFSNGYLVNMGVISSLLRKNDYVVGDKLNHASIVDGCRFSEANTVRFRHNDMKDLAKVLKSLPEQVGKLLVVDGVFSMEGDIANLPEIVRVAKPFGVRIMVDDAHAIGVLGPNGNGTAAHFGLDDQVDLIMGTFSKSFGALGGFIAGAYEVVDYIKHNARSMIFTASLPPSVVASTRAALQIIKAEPERRQRLIEIGNYMRREFKRLGFDTSTSETPVIPIVIGDNLKTFTFWKMLFEAGVYSNAVISPAVPSNSSRLRTSYIATHKQEQLDFVLDKFAQIGKQLGVI
ncbi:MAG: aminotransferase class I/II-fold pyridoxal phosphate-dependent enzyme [Candidatus Marinimicrobia bacterium]|nr:aminotransferase class I/II-fold pyridoxal phosphate-dependent enzyme [Candidatus Neomarinimicrobiota bacterium]MDD5230982.1 aminotransferase class I/II-fold pyridoxal phosphate-dependent enzyme [Candidatus Neomarinimicrobiota bacterium]MDD5540004.1 aminotransferase class I/II-fold pyridoxal phosphate-dependent enzyme [Candidatus Neomarinimicrobiota bacterium]